MSVGGEGGEGDEGVVVDGMLLAQNKETGKKPARIFFVVDRRDRTWYPVRCQAIGVGAPFSQSECMGIGDGV